VRKVLEVEAEETHMATNQFESSRIAGGTLNTGAQKVTGTPREAPVESDAISRNDERDGAERAPAHDPKNNRPVLAASTIAGDRVRNGAGEDLGTIEEVMLDVPTGRIAYAVISFGGFLGIGDKLFAVPWKALRINTTEHEFILDVPKQTLEAAPGFDKNNWPDMADPEFSGPLHEFYGQAPYWEQDFTEAGDYIGDVTPPNRSNEYEPEEEYRPATKR
jgi:sporulation protein YlmC with PRC-barrel domain